MPPVITSISPSEGPERGGTVVVITGSGFSTGDQLLASVRFGANRAITCNVDSDTQITALSPAGTGEVNIVVATLFEISRIDSGSLFTFRKASADEPMITGISPAAGPVEGGIEIEITGSGLLGTTQVSFGAMTVRDPLIVDDSRLLVTLPPLGEGYGPGSVHVSVTTPSGISAATAADEFSYVAAPTVSALSPSNGDPAGGDAITLTGTNLSQVTEVWFGGVQAFGLAAYGDEELSVFSPEGMAGETVDVVVVSPGGVSETNETARFIYAGDNQMPVISGIVPPIGNLADPEAEVALVGANLGNIAAVWFGGVEGTDLQLIDDTQLRVTTPYAYEPSKVSVIVQSNEGAFSVRNDNALFEYLGEDDYLAQIGTLGGGSGSPATGVGTKPITIEVKQRFTINHTIGQSFPFRVRNIPVADGVVLTFEPSFGGQSVTATVSGGQGKASIWLQDGSYFVTLSAAAIDRQAPAPAGPDLVTSSSADLYLDLAFILTVTNGQIDPDYPPHVESGVVHGDVFRGGASSLLVDWKPEWVQAIGAYDRPQELGAIVVHRTDKPNTPQIDYFKGHRPAHYLVDVDGHVVKFLMEAQQADHVTSRSWWDGILDLNQAAIGIEIVNVKNTEFTPAQVEATKELVLALLSSFGLSRHHVVGHGEVMFTSLTDRTLHRDRRFDPGQEFGWPILEAASACTGLITPDENEIQAMYSGYFGLFPQLLMGDDDADKANRRASTNPSTAARAKFIFDNKVVSQVQTDLRTLGYTVNKDDFIKITGVMDYTTLETVDRFKRRYYSGTRRKRVDDNTIVFDASDALTLLSAVKDRGLP